MNIELKKTLTQPQVAKVDFLVEEVKFIAGISATFRDFEERFIVIAGNVGLTYAETELFAEKTGIKIFPVTTPIH